MVSIQVASAETGTETYTGTPKSLRPEAMPANSDTLTAKLDTHRLSIAMAEMRMPNFSRMREANPLPVAQPMRAAVSCTTMSRRHIRGTVHSWPKP